MKLLLVLILPLTVFGNSVALKNFRELYESLQVATHVSPTSTDPLATLFEQVQETLPSESGVGNYSGSMQWALVKLTSEFCKVRILADSKLAPSERWVHKKVNFALNAASQDLVSVGEEYASLFWQRAPTIEEATEIAAFLKGVISESPALVPILTALCTVMGTSIDSVTL